MLGNREVMTEAVCCLILDLCMCACPVLNSNYLQRLPLFVNVPDIAQLSLFDYRYGRTLLDLWPPCREHTAWTADKGTKQPLIFNKSQAGKLA